MPDNNSPISLYEVHQGGECRAWSTRPLWAMAAAGSVSCGGPGRAVVWDYGRTVIDGTPPVAIAAFVRGVQVSIDRRQQ
jgi:hypothetical protein